MRLKLAVSQTECASKLGISQTHLSNIEHGRSGITLQMLCRVCDILQVSLDYLVRGAEKTDEKKRFAKSIEKFHKGIVYYSEEQDTFVLNRFYMPEQEQKNAEGHRRKVSPADSKFIIKKEQTILVCSFLSEYLNYYFAESCIFHHCKSG